jgi:peroxiredoxin
MTRRTTSTRALTLLVGLAVAIPVSADLDEAVVGAQAPGFSLRVLNPEAAGINWLSLRSLVGEEAEDGDARVVLVTFFASWCAPCKKELPLLVDLDRQYRSLGLRVVGISIDKEEDGITAAKKLAAYHHAAYPVLSDRFNLLARRYLGDQAPLPSVFLIGRDGNIISIERGYTKDASVFLRAKVEAALGIKRAAASIGAKAP